MAPAAPRPSDVPARDLDDTTFITTIPDADLAACHALADEAGRRRLVAAVPALEVLCWRFKGLGLHYALPEQTAAIRGLGAIGGPMELFSAMGRL